MTYTGKVVGGSIVIQGNERPEEGALVRIEVVEDPDHLSAVAKTLLKFSGIIEGLPSDSAVNLDHYLYGLPKQSE